MAWPTLFAQYIESATARQLMMNFISGLATVFTKSASRTSRAKSARSKKLVRSLQSDLSRDVT